MKTERLSLYFSGIGGSGLSAIAAFMTFKGHTVSGSDRAFETNPYHPALSTLKNNGIAIYPQDGSGIKAGLDLAVFSTAVEHDTPEYQKGLALGIKMLTRPQYLARIVAEYKTIAVAGTSGKSTTSGMLAYLMSRLGMKPNFIGGGRVKQFRTDSNPGNALAGESDLLVIEACESDGTIVDYRPEHTILLNLELDHHSVKETADMFVQLIDNTRGMVVVNADDANLMQLPKNKIERCITFSINASSRFRAEEIKYNLLSTDFMVNGMKLRLSIPGEYNLSNAMSCIALLNGMGVELKAIAKVLPDFTGIERRFDVHMDNTAHLVIDDYAHNPHKIASFMQAASRLRERICYIFQPHGFGPTRMMRDEYIAAFSEGLRESDHLILLPIYYAGGTAAKDISSDDLAEGIKKNGRSVEVAKDRNHVIKNISRWDNYIVLGARDESLSSFAKAIAMVLKLE